MSNTNDTNTATGEPTIDEATGATGATPAATPAATPEATVDPLTTALAKAQAAYDALMAKLHEREVALTAAQAAIDDNVKLGAIHAEAIAASAAIYESRLAAGDRPADITIHLHRNASGTYDREARSVAPLAWGGKARRASASASNGNGSTHTTIVNRDLPNGTILTATHKGQEHLAEVVVASDGTRSYKLASGREYKSPSAAAQAITGASANGWSFGASRPPRVTRPQARHPHTARGREAGGRATIQLVN